VARYTGPVCRLCRREGLKLFLKGERCFTEKCAIERRAFAPGQHGQKHGKLSDYGRQLREKQKGKRMYGLVEKQFHRYYEIASRKKGIAGENLLQLLERRLDNVVYRLGFTANRTEARQLVRHGHFKINGRRVTIPSLQVKPGDVIEVRQKSTQLARILEAVDAVDRRGIPAWLDLDKSKLTGKIAALPARVDITMPIEEHLIIELYSK